MKKHDFGNYALVFNMSRMRVNIFMNQFAIRQVDEFIVFDIKTSNFSVENFNFLFLAVKKCELSKKILINMNKVDYIDNDFINYFIEFSSKNTKWNICFYDLNPVINSLFYIFNLDKHFEIYINEKDSIKKSTPLVRRRLKLVS